MGSHVEKTPFYPCKFVPKVFGRKKYLFREKQKLKTKKMFGLNEITWKTFTQFICTGLLAWYLIIFILAVIKSSKKQKNLHYEDIQEEGEGHENLQPIAVSSNDFPSEIISVLSGEDIPVEVSFYEETGLDEGFGIEHFLQNEDPMLPKLLEKNQIHFQK